MCAFIDVSVTSGLPGSSRIKRKFAERLASTFNAPNF